VAHDETEDHEDRAVKASYVAKQSHEGVGLSLVKLFRVSHSDKKLVERVLESPIPHKFLSISVDYKG